ncbi:hypothetical protein F5Y05DRAFT_161682 [Hypoxylon sp. FL0543]|nr:hypothetical protein F5Y05DRAFT_161682 [Hypoxylon sp. FL0543]
MGMGAKSDTLVLGLPLAPPIIRGLLPCGSPGRTGMVAAHLFRLTSRLAAPWPSVGLGPRATEEAKRSLDDCSRGSLLVESSPGKRIFCFDPDHSESPRPVLLLLSISVPLTAAGLLYRRPAIGREFTTWQMSNLTRVIYFAWSIQDEPSA